jgi:DNA-binding PadR family transcriptional regulator
VGRPAGTFLSDGSLLVLIALATGPKHGYAIQTDIREFSAVELGPGTLYVILPRLERDGLIEPLPAEGRRRPYRITGSGRELLQAELNQAGSLSKVGLRRLEEAES